MGTFQSARVKNSHEEGDRETATTISGSRVVSLPGPDTPKSLREFGTAATLIFYTEVSLMLRTKITPTPRSHFSLFSVINN